MIRSILIAVIVLSAYSSIAEKIKITSDRNIYGAGENIWFSACLEETKSAVLYVDLSNSSGEIFSKGKFKITENQASGTLKIDEDLRTGVYYLRCFTKLNLSAKKSSAAAVEIVVINHLGTPLTALKEGLNSSSFNINLRQASTQITSNGIELTVSNLQPGDYTVSIVPSGSFNHAKQNIDISVTGKETSEFLEERSTSLKGILINPKSKDPLSNVMVVGSTIGKHSELHISRTNAKGEFILVFRSITPDEVVYLTTPEMSDGETKFLIEQEYPFLKPEIQESELVIDDSLKAIYNRISFTSRMIQRFGKGEFNHSRTQPVPSPFSTPTENIFLADYIALGSMKEVFTELIPYAGVREKAGVQRITMYDHRNHKPMENPMVLFDNVPLVDHEAILKIDPSKIKSISVIANPYYYGDEKINGIVAIYSKNGRLGGMELPKSVSLIDFSGFEDTYTWKLNNQFNSGESSLANTLYWSNSETIQGNEFSLNFDPTQNRGDYDLILIEKGIKASEVYIASFSIQAKQ